MELYPLEVNQQTAEPYLRLPPPYAHIIITPPRMSDAPTIVQILNDPRVYKSLQGPPYPYLPEHAQSWLLSVTLQSDAVLRDLKEAGGDGKLKIVDDCPVRSLREVKEDGTDVYLGDCTIDRWGWPEIVDRDQRQRLTDGNVARKAGDPDILWGIGDYIASSHHGKGIMTAAVAALRSQWWIPRMGVCHIRAAAFKGNQASVRVFEKNGFGIITTVEDCIEARGEIFSIHVLEWHASANAQA